MKIEIKKIIDKGVKDKERLWLKVLEDCDLTYYIVFNTVYSSPNSISTFPKDTYWFKPKKVKAGDSVILYTRKGNPSIKENADKSNNHFLFWNLYKTLWNDKDDCAVVFEINSWGTTEND
jgi:hypothetical protein